MKIVASEMAGQQCCQHGTKICSHAGYFTQYPLYSFLLFLKLRSLGPSYMMYLLITFEVPLSIQITYDLSISKLFVP